MRLTAYVWNVRGMRNVCRALVGKTEGKTPHGNLGGKGRIMHWSLNKCSK